MALSCVIWVNHGLGQAVALAQPLVDPCGSFAPCEGAEDPTAALTVFLPTPLDTEHLRWLLPPQGAARLRARTWRTAPEVERLLARTPGMNVLLIMVDSLRASPFEDPTRSARRFPHLGAFRQRAHWFTNAFSPAAGTDLCMGGTLTGNLDPMSGAPFTLPELLSAAGYKSHAVIPSEVVRATSKTLLTRGLGSYEILVTDPWKPNVATEISSPHITNLGLSFVDRWRAERDPRRPHPFFLWLHYFDVHEHHQLADELPEIVAHNGGKTPESKLEKYEALLSITDEALGRLFEGLASRGLSDNTIVVLAADHGESLKEDPRLPENHGLVLYNPLVHIPLAFAVPGTEGGDVPQLASLLDVPTTLLDLIGLPIPASMQGGQSLLPALVDVLPVEDRPRRLVLNESDQYAVIEWPWKLLVRRKTAAAELYDLSQDFGETLNLAETLPEKVNALSRAYQATPAINLDRTRAGRKRFEELARSTRPAPAELARLVRRSPPPPRATSAETN